MSKIATLVANFGIKNIVVRASDRPVHTFAGLISFTTSSDEPVEVTRGLTDRRYDPVEDYKIELEATEVDGLRFGFQSYYTLDFDLLWREGHVRVFTIGQNGDDLYYTEVIYVR